MDAKTLRFEIMLMILIYIVAFFVYLLISAIFILDLIFYKVLYMNAIDVIKKVMQFALLAAHFVVKLVADVVNFVVDLIEKIVAALEKKDAPVVDVKPADVAPVVDAPKDPAA